MPVLLTQSQSIDPIVRLSVLRRVLKNKTFLSISCLGRVYSVAPVAPRPQNCALNPLPHPMVIVDLRYGDLDKGYIL